MCTLCAKWRIGQDDLVSRTWIFDEAISDRYGTLSLTDAMEEHIHHCQSSCLSHEFLSADDFFFELLLFIAIELAVFEYVVMSLEEESTRSRTRIMDCRMDRRSHHFDHGSDEDARSEVLSRS